MKDGKSSCSGNLFNSPGEAMKAQNALMAKWKPNSIFDKFDNGKYRPKDYSHTIQIPWKE